MPMPDDLKKVVQSMIDKGESDEAISSVIKMYQSKHPTTPAQPAVKPQPMGDTYKGPDTFWGGVMHALRPGGEADQASLEGAGGYLKGALLDLPSSIGGALSNIGESVMHPIDTATKGWDALMHPSEVYHGVVDPMVETTKRAGSDPSAFGEMMGQLTGQPLATEGLVKGAPAVAPAVARGTGSALSGTGKILSQYKPVTGMLPRIMEPRIARTLEGAMGRGMTRIGESLKGMGTPKVNGEVVPPLGENPFFREGEIIPDEPPTQTARPQLNASQTTQTGYSPYFGESRQLTPEVIMESQAPGRPMGYDFTGPQEAPPPPYPIPDEPQPTVLPPRGRQFNLPAQSATSYPPGTFIDVTTGEALTQEQLLARIKGQPTSGSPSSAPLETTPTKGGVESKAPTSTVSGASEAPSGANKTPSTKGKTTSSKGKTEIGQTYRVDKLKMTPDFLSNAQKNGFQMVGQTPQGDFLFKRIK